MLLSISLISIVEVGGLLYDKDIAAYEAKYRIEEISKSKLSETNCSKLDGYISECYLAKHKMKLIVISSELALQITTLCFRLGMIIIFLSIIAFFVQPYNDESDSNKT